MIAADVEIVENPSPVDWPALHSLVIEAFAYMDGIIDPPSSLHRMTASDFEQKAKDETLIIARLNGDLVGCMFCRPEGDWLYVGKVAVSMRQQGRGIGRAMFEHAFATAKDRGFQGLELQTRVELTGNHKTFGRLGFIKVGEDAHEGYDRPTSICMRAEVRSSAPPR